MNQSSALDVVLRTKGIHMRSIILSVLLAGVTAVALTSGASAQGRKRVRVIEAYDTSSLNSLTVNHRSWLDSGNTVHSGSVNGGQSYVAASTIYNKTPDKVFAPDSFGNDVISGQPYVPGRSRAVVEFSSLPNGVPVIENVVGAQNYYFNPAPPELPRQAAIVDPFPTR